jgi:hypothetical protein
LASAPLGSSGMLLLFQKIAKFIVGHALYAIYREMWKRICFPNRSVAAPTLDTRLQIANISHEPRFRGV